MAVSVGASVFIGKICFSGFQLPSMPVWMLYVCFGLSVFLFLASFCGTYGAYQEMKKVRTLYDNKDEPEDHVQGKGRCCMLFFLITCAVFFLLHFCIAVGSLVYSGHVANVVGSHNSVEKTDEHTHKVMDSASGKAEVWVDEHYGPEFVDTKWIDFQDYFGCCGYSMADTRPWTGACCPCPYDPEHPDVCRSGGEEPSPEYLAIQKSKQPGNADVRRRRLQGNATHFVVSDDEESDTAHYEPALGEDMPCMEGKGKGTCSQMFADTFSESGLFMLGLSFAEFLAVLVGCCLHRLAKVSDGEDGGDEFQA